MFVQFIGFFFLHHFLVAMNKKMIFFCFVLFDCDDFGILFFKQMRNGEMILENCQMSNQKWGYKFMIFFLVMFESKSIVF
jgi:hypothetical protein